MISNISSNYESICKYFDFNKTNNVDENKKILLEMANNGDDRPSKKKTKIGQALDRYTRKTSLSYDEKFHSQIRNIRKDWFVSQRDKANEKKKKLLYLAKNNKSKPHWKTDLGRSLVKYTNKKIKNYDKKFDDLIHKLRPDWFVDKSQIANLKKQRLLEIAKSEKKRPGKKTKIGKVLVAYCSKTASSYDQKFRILIRKTRPDWFVDADSTKRQILKMSKNKKFRPICKTKIGDALRRYTQKKSKSYDRKFHILILKKRPDWFKKSALPLN